MSKQSIRVRRVLFYEDLVGRVYTFSYRRSLGLHEELLEWLDTRTGGVFYLGLGRLCFEREEDALMFRLSKFADSNDFTVNRKKASLSYENCTAEVSK